VYAVKSIAEVELHQHVVPREFF